MGYSMGAAMGGQMGCPDKTVVMFAGDGGFHMNLSELATMCSYNIPVKNVYYEQYRFGYGTSVAKAFL